VSKHHIIEAYKYHHSRYRQCGDRSVPRFDRFNRLKEPLLDRQWVGPSTGLGMVVAGVEPHLI